mmetsp:Transcript_56095/g.156290  ORF Transcript_56095/g.156290 Transcript_56095/m.156290 type:complete len:85 (+) Transcript_56095:2176-2430(+)
MAQGGRARGPANIPAAPRKVAPATLVVVAQGAAAALAGKGAKAEVNRRGAVARETVLAFGGAAEPGTSAKGVMVGEGELAREAQ